MQETTINGKPQGVRPPPYFQPLPLGGEQQAAALPPAIAGLLSPEGSVASKDSGIASLTDGEQNDMQGEGRRGVDDKDKDDGSNDSGNDSHDDMDTN